MLVFNPVTRQFVEDKRRDYFGAEEKTAKIILTASIKKWKSATIP